MSVNINYPYTTASNYIFDSDKIELDAGKAKLKLQQADVNFNEDFADDTDFTYDNTKAEFTGGLVRQKDKSLGSLFAVSYTVNQNANWAVDVSTGILGGTASVSSGKLDLTGDVISYCKYNSENNLGLQIGAIRFKYTPNYNNAPSSSKWLVYDATVDSYHNNLELFHFLSGVLYFRVRSHTTYAINVSLPQWLPTQGQEYEFEINYDFTNGETRVFIEGVQHGSTINTIFTRYSHGDLYIGTDNSQSGTADGKFDDIMLFNSVQHTANYTKGYTVTEYKYLNSSVVLPEMAHTGDGTIKLFNSLASTYAGSPRILLEKDRSGDKLYWTGTIWDVSDETYDQATDPVTFNTNCFLLDVDGDEYGQFTIIFPDSNTLSSFSDLAANMNVDIGYPTTNPTIETNTSFRADGLEGFTETSTITGTDNIKHILKKNSSYYYWNGTAWAVSNETYTQSNTATEIETNKASFLTEGEGKVIKVKSFLHSADGTTKPDLDTISINYNYSGDAITLIEVIIYGYLRDIVDALESETIKVRPHWIVGDKSIIAGSIYSYTTLTDGYFEITMSYEDIAPTYLEWRIKNKIYKTNFLEQDFVKFGELTILWQNTLNIDLLGT